MKPTMAILGRKIRSMARIDRFSLAWLIPAMLMMGIAGVALRFVAFRRIAPWLGRDQAARVAVPLASRAERRRAHRIRQAVSLAARNAPWRSDCFPQGATASVMLRLYRVPYAVYYGARLRRDAQEGGMQAHVWVMSGPVAVTGGDCFGHYPVLATFAGCDLET